MKNDDKLKAGNHRVTGHAAGAQKELSRMHVNKLNWAKPRTGLNLVQRTSALFAYNNGVAVHITISPYNDKLEAQHPKQLNCIG